MKLTIYEMADKAGVSIATISRALNPETRSKVAAETLRKIDALVEKHGYTPSLAAKNLSNAAYKTIGVLFPHHAGIFFEDYYSKILAGAADALLDSNYHLKVVMLKCEKPRWDRHNFHSGEGIDGLVVTHWHAFFSDKAVLEKLGVPAVIISDPEKNVKAHFVSGDHVEGGRLAAAHLTAQGHTRIGVLTGSPDSKDSADRLKGFTEILKAQKLSPAAVACAHFQEEKAEALIGDFMRQNPGLTAVFCLNDAMALGALRGLKKAGLRCPQDISIVGYDNEKRTESFDPPVSTVAVPVYEMAREAGRLLVQYLNTKDSKAFFGKTTVLPVELIARKSVRKA